MSIWGDIRKRAEGRDITQEEFVSIYTGKSKTEPITSGDHKSCQYTVWTCGRYPFITMDIHRSMSAFAGAGGIEVETPEGEKFNLDRKSDGSKSTYTYDFDKDDDYVLGEHKGKKHTVQELEDIAKLLIDLILKSEDDLSSRMMRS